jgi:DNA-directed RNA polymerase subunit H (RpoH/RPB5)
MSVSNAVSFVFKSRRTVIELMKTQGYNVGDYDNFSINEVNTMHSQSQLDMLLEKNEVNKKTNKKDKIYIRYYLAKSIRPQNVQEMIDDLFNLEEVLSKEDTLLIIAKEEMNDTMRNFVKHIWESEGIFVIIQNIKRLQFNILQHSLVPSHKIMIEEEVADLMKTYNITKLELLPDISRFDPVAQAICLRPGQICEILRPSKTSILSKYYRVCI